MTLNQGSVDSGRRRWGRVRKAVAWFESLNIFRQLPVGFGTIGAVGGAVVIIFIAAGQIGAVGIRQAWGSNGESWLLTPLIAALSGIGIGLSLDLMFAAILAADALLRRFSVSRKRLRIGWYSILAIVIAWFLIDVSYDDALKRGPQIGGTPGAMRASVKKQEEALKGLSSNARNLLTQLDTTQREIVASRSTLIKTLAGLEEQRLAITRSVRAIEDIQNGQVAVDEQIRRLQLALAGREPITRADLQRSQWSGFALGVAASIVAAWILRLLSKVGARLRRPNA